MELWTVNPSFISREFHQRLCTDDRPGHIPLPIFLCDFAELLQRTAYQPGLCLFYRTPPVIAATVGPPSSTMVVAVGESGGATKEHKRRDEIPSIQSIVLQIDVYKTDRRRNDIDREHLLSLQTDDLHETAPQDMYAHTYLPFGRTGVRALSR
jgi:hypothetical protein